MLEITQGLTDKLVEGKGVGILGYDIFEVHELMLIYYAYENAALNARIGADSIYLGCAVAELFCYVGRYFVGMRRDDRELVGGLRTLDNVVADEV